MVWRLTGKLLNSLWLLAALLIIVVAIVVALGRELVPLAGRYQGQVNQFISDQIGLPITTATLAGTWEGFAPRLVASGVEIHGRDGEAPAITLERAVAQLDLWRSLLSFGVVWRELEASGVQVIAEEDAEGRWWVAGLPIGDGNGATLAMVRDLLTETRLLRIEQATAELHFFSGTRVSLRAPSVRIDNSGDFHRTVARLAFADDPEDAARVIFEASGSPRAGGFRGRGHIALNRINFDGTVSALARQWFPAQVERVGDIATDLDLALWFDWEEGALLNGRGTLRAAELPLGWVVDAGSLTDLDAAITAWYQPGEDWGLTVQNLRVTWAGEAVEPLSLTFRQRVGRRWGELDLVVDQLDLAVTHDLLRRTVLLDERLAGVLDQLQPTGVVRGLELDLDLSADAPAVLARGNLDRVALEPWRGAPAARNVSGYFEVRGADGFVELDSPEGLQLLYAPVYQDYMPYGAVRGRVDWRWRPDSRRVEVVSGPIAIDGDEGQGTAWLYLDVPTLRGDRAPHMDLMVALRNSRVAFVDRYLPAVLDPGLRQWLDRALVAGEIPEAGFIWRGALAGGNPGERTLQVHARVEDATLDYHADWPALTGLSATLLVDDGLLDVWADGAETGGARVGETQVRLRPAHGDGLRLNVRGQLFTDAGNALEVLRDSPVAGYLEGLGGWRLEGRAEANLDLDIPLAGASGEEYQVGVTLAEGRIHLPDTALDIDGIDGRVDFSLADGLASRGLTGRFLGQRLDASVEGGPGETLVNLSSRLTVEALSPWLGPAGAYLAGHGDITGQLRLAPAGEDPVLHLTSDLQGLAIDLPAPFGKEAEQALSLAATLSFSGGDLRIHGALRDRLALALRFDDGAFRAGAVELMAESAALPREPVLLVRGALPSLDWADWQPFIAGQDNVEGGLRALSPRLDLAIGDLTFQGFSLGETTLRGGLDGDDSWRLSLTSDRVAGEVVPGGERARLRLEYLHLPSLAAEAGWGELQEGEEADAVDEGGDGFLDRLDPRGIPALDFAADLITLGERDLGSLAFISTPLADGVRIEAIQGTVRGLTLPDAQSEEVPQLAELEWRVDGDRHATRFAGTVLVADFAAALTAWQLPPLVDTRAAAFTADLAWPERPWSFSAANLGGHVGIDLDNGQFYRATGVPTNTFLRLVSLLNFDTWLRRLRFDFTDLFNQGVSFDHLRGGLVFDQGVVRFDEPIVAAMPSGRVRLLGSADMVAEQLDARLVATLPVGTNLPWVAALLGGLPAAAGVYVTGRLFRRQVDQLSSLSYRVSGPWDDPKLEVDKIFSDKTDLEE